MSKRDFDDFDDFARNYREIHNKAIKAGGADSDYFSEQKIGEVRKNEIADDPRILDLGCGDGNSASFFCKYFPDARYSGLDISHESVDVARERSIPNAEFFRYDGIDIPFSGDTFDIVFVSCVMHHISFDLHENFLQEVRRVMKTGGRLYVFEHNPSNPVTRRIVRACPFDADAILLSSRYTKRLLSRLGFNDVKIDYTLFFPRLSIFRKILGLEEYLKWLPLGGQYFARSIKTD